MRAKSLTFCKGVARQQTTDWHFCARARKNFSASGCKAQVSVCPSITMAYDRSCEPCHPPSGWGDWGGLVGVGLEGAAFKSCSARGDCGLPDKSRCSWPRWWTSRSSVASCHTAGEKQYKSHLCLSHCVSPIQIVHTTVLTQTLLTQTPLQVKIMFKTKWLKNPYLLSKMHFCFVNFPKNSGKKTVILTVSATMCNSDSTMQKDRNRKTKLLVHLWVIQRMGLTMIYLAMCIDGDDCLSLADKLGGIGNLNGCLLKLQYSQQPIIVSNSINLKI